MTNYSEHQHMVRADFFKPTGKLYMTEALDMGGLYGYGAYPEDAVHEAFNRTERGRVLLDSFTIVVIEPYHVRAYPVMLISAPYRNALVTIRNQQGG